MNEDGDIAKLIDNCDLIILASPLETVVPYAEQIAKLHNGSKPLYVIDIASVKNTILPVFKKLSSDNLHFISTHPIAGKEISGYENSDPFLFVNRPWWIFEESPLIEDFIHFVGAIPIHISGEQHDKYAALVSHLPILLSYSYYHFVMRQNKESLEMSGPSFASFTRLAHENPALMKEIFKNNHKTLHDLLGKWVKYLKDIE
jgi:prephenate dehydrogenase